MTQKIVRDDAGTAQAFWIDLNGILRVSAFSTATGAWSAPSGLTSQFGASGPFDPARNDSDGWLVAHIHIVDLLNNIRVLEVKGTVTNTQISANVTSPSFVKAAISDNGDAIVIWDHGSVLRYRLFRSGSWEAEGVLDTATSGALDNVDVAAGNLGNFTVAWIWETDTQTLHGKRFFGGTWSGRETIGLPERTAPLRSPQVTMMGADEALVVWEQPLVTPGVYGIGARYFNGSAWQATQNIHSGAGTTLARWPHIASHDNGEAMASWGQGTVSGSLRIYAARFQSGTWFQTQEIGCAPATFGQPLNVDMDKYGNAVVAYMSGGSNLLHRTWQAGLGWLDCFSQGTNGWTGVGTVSQNGGGLEKRVVITPHHIHGIFANSSQDVFAGTVIKDVYINNFDETTESAIVDLNMTLPFNTVCGTVSPFFFTEMRFSNDGSTWSNWQATPTTSPFTQTIPGWDLTDPATGGIASGGLKRVHIDFRNPNCSGEVTHDEIEYTPACVPTTEICDGIDNDCDGETDEGLSTDFDGDGFYTPGSCASPATDCNDNNSAIFPEAPELCDSLDNDCDLSVDEGLSTDFDGDGFYTVGSCMAPANDCDDGNFDINPGATELCDGVDNNCTNGVDENFGAGSTCFAGIGACEAFGLNQCTIDGTGTFCDAIPGQPTTETCDSIDNDCDGTTDEDFTVGQSCSVGLGACQANGAEICAIDGSGTVCDAVAGTPTVEICDGIDNNCDGVVDDGLSTDNDGDGHYIAGSCLVPADDCDDNNSSIWDCNTPVGDDPVQFDDPAGNASVVIEGITGGGDTTITSVENCDPPAPEPGFIIPSNPVCVTVDSDATFSSAEVCIVYDPAELSSPFILVQQCQNDGSSCEVLVPTIEDVPGGLKQACVTVTSFSEFLTGEAADTDTDLIPDVFDNCPTTFNQGQDDFDEDGHGDLCDNCAAEANSTQLDTNGDGFGNLCDPDFNGNGVVDPFDFSLLKSRFGQSGFPDQDLNGNGIVDPFDFSKLKSMFGQPPGPANVDMTP